MQHKIMIDCSSLIPTDQAETVSRRIEKFADLMQSIWVSRNDYERRVRAVRDKLLHQVAEPKSNGITAPYCPQRDTRNVGFSEIYGYICGREGTCGEICDVQADHEESVGHGETRSGHPSRKRSNEAQDLQVEALCTTSRPCPFCSYYLRNLTNPSSCFNRTSMKRGRSS